MPPATDYIEHLGRLARKLYTEAGLGGSAPQPDAEFYKVLAKATEQIVQGFNAISRRE
jgi:hypothetical protein